MANIRLPWIIKMGLTERARASAASWPPSPARWGRERDAQQQLQAGVGMWPIAWNPSNHSPKCPHVPGAFLHKGVRGPSPLTGGAPLGTWTIVRPGRGGLRGVLRLCQACMEQGAVWVMPLPRWPAIQGHGRICSTLSAELTALGHRVRAGVFLRGNVGK